MATLTPPAAVVGAVRQPLPYGLFSTLSLRAAGADRWESGVTWEPETCSKADGIQQLQVTGGAIGTTIGLPKTLTKNLTLPSSQPAASAFTIYGHFNASPVGWTVDEARARAVSHLQNREEARVEQAFWTGDLVNTPTLQGATVIGVGTTDVVGGLGLLESYIASNYGSLGVIHMTRASATALLARYALEAKGGRLTTLLGTPVAAGSGYPGTSPAGVAAAAGTQWMYVTPAMFGYRSEIFDSSNVAGDLFDRGLNNLYAVAERSYLLGFDPCGVAAVLVDTD